MKFKTIFLLLALFSQLSIAKKPLNSSLLNKLSGEQDKSYDTKSRWDQRYNKKKYVYGKLPAKFLAENFDYLKNMSEVLDLGMGEGRNAVFLASKGHKVTGIDISSVAVKKAKTLAREKNVKIQTIVGKLEKYEFHKQFDVVICFYYLDRSLIEKIKSLVKPGGILIFEAHTLKEYEANKRIKLNKDYYLKSQELLTLFSGMTILKFEEPLHESEFRSSIILKKDGVK